MGVAGTVGGITGVAPGARLISINAISAPGVPIVEALRWVAANAERYKITALVVAVYKYGPRDNPLCGTGVPTGFGEAIRELARLDLAVIFSAGNSGNLTSAQAPACMPGVISVSATEAAAPYVIGQFSNISRDVDMLAPAGMLSAGLSNTTMRFGGTSQAAPFIAGVFALAKQARPDANIAQIYSLMRSTGQSVDDAIIKRIPVVQPKELIAALQSSTPLPKVSRVSDVQDKLG